MNAKLFTFATGSAVGIIVGIAVGLMISSGAKNDPDEDKVAEKTQPPRLTSADPQKKIADLEKEIAELKKAKGSDAEAEIASTDDHSEGTKKPVMKIFGAGGNSQIDFAELQKHIEAEEAENSAKRVESKLASLSRALDLTDDQEEKVGALLKKEEKQSRSRVSGLLKLASGAVAGEIMDVEIPSLSSVSEIDSGSGEGGEFDFDTELLSLLDDDQAGAYEEYQTVRRENRIEAEAGQQLASLQTTVPDLTTEQKDQAFAEFARIAREGEERNGAGDGTIDIQRMSQERDEQMTAMEGILTPEQMEVYQATNSVRSISFGGGDGGSPTFITSEVSIGVSSDSIPDSGVPETTTGEE